MWRRSYTMLVATDIVTQTRIGPSAQLNDYFAVRTMVIPLLGDWNSTLSGLTPRGSGSRLTHPVYHRGLGPMRRLAAFVLLTFVSSSFAQGQSTNASLTGRVSDAAKALVVGAKVAAVSDG